MRRMYDGAAASVCALLMLMSGLCKRKRERGVFVFAGRVIINYGIVKSINLTHKTICVNERVNGCEGIARKPRKFNLGKLRFVFVYGDAEDDNATQIVS